MRPKRAKDIIARDVEEETVVITPDAGRAIVLNAIGGAIFDLCDGTRTVDEIVDFIRDNVAGADAEVHRDVAAIVAQLIEAGVVEDLDPCGLPPSES